MKTVKDANPFTQSRIRAISGRNAPVYSHGISDPLADIQATGRAVLEVWNARLDEAANLYDDLRIVILIRNMSTLEFSIMEHEASRFIPTNYQWTKNSGGNLIGKHTTTDLHHFTWQPSGGQFTVVHFIPASAYLFRVKRPGLVDAQKILDLVHYDDSWIQSVVRSTGS